MELTLSGLVAIFCGLVGWHRLDWPLIVVGSVSLALVVLTAALHWGEIRVELGKKMHL
jgi:ABC-type glycerol-3-phosphate transport system permease component